MTTINRLGGKTQEHRPFTPYERGQIETHLPTVGVAEMARRLHRTRDSVRHFWDSLKEQRRQERAA